ncbi:MAG: hypothetical protein KJ871_00325 [Alphaproteobacteria bacterium]|nr:hypothetical protein [Alphaproteobacteria bacterium]MBU2083762.1 hypothetical protein [Alphaproteobacteria bacterium]MBU2142548.1 hypothetical protein [Alphaproteobacteria bacterium]MBU2197699.1 hypothetical protein [Alphaproteobacteria bacterium]
MKIFAILSMLAVICATNSNAEPVESNQTAQNGVNIKVYTDEFADRQEYNAPSVAFKVDEFPVESKVLFYRIREGGKLSPIVVNFMVIYPGDWSRYDKVVFKGGEEAEFHEIERKVMDCSMSECVYMERFAIGITPNQITKYSEDGEIKVQIRALDSKSTIISLPTANFEALNALK